MRADRLNVNVLVCALYSTDMRTAKYPFCGPTDLLNNMFILVPFFKKGHVMKKKQHILFESMNLGAHVQTQNPNI